MESMVQQLQEGAAACKVQIEDLRQLVAQKDDLLLKANEEIQQSKV